MVECERAAEARDWTAGAAKWIAVGMLGLASIGGMLFSAHAWHQRQRAAALELDTRIDLNAASAAELRLLPGIGPTLAERIVADRTENGPFGSLEALERVSGLGPKTMAEIAGMVRID